MINGLYTPDEIWEMGRTEEGRRKFARYIWSARSAMAAQRVMEILDIIPDAQTQQILCDAIWDTVFRRDTFEIMDWIKASHGV